MEIAISHLLGLTTQWNLLSLIVPFFCEIYNGFLMLKMDIMRHVYVSEMCVCAGKWIEMQTKTIQTNKPHQFLGEKDIKSCSPEQKWGRERKPVSGYSNVIPRNILSRVTMSLEAGSQQPYKRNG